MLADVKYGRKVDEGNGPRLVSPLTTVTIDPSDGLAVPGTLVPLAAGVDVKRLQSLAIGPDYLPRVVPRNAVLQLEFTDPVDPASVVADEIDASGALVSPGSVQVRTQDGRPVRVTVTVHGASTIWIDPVGPGSVGFPPSPIDFGPGGEPRADATGFLKLRLPRSGGPILRATDGTFLGARRDHLGDPNQPIGLNPGNAVLDFIAEEHLIPSNETFNGFLPDIDSPRIVRTHADVRTLDFAGGDGATVSTVTVASAGWSTIARGGSGEWAGGRLVLRPGAVDQEVHEVAGNDATVVTIAGTFAALPRDGDVIRLERIAYFEPDLTDPIDPALFDPDDPQNGVNAQLESFVEVWEIDAQGNAVAGPTSIRDPVPAFAELRVRFSESIAEESLRQWETFEVTFVPDSDEILSDVTLDPGQTVATIRPVRVDQQAGTFEVVGWGKGDKNLQLVLTTVPKESFLRQHLSTDELAAFLDLGIRTITDLGGQPLDFPRSAFDPAAPALQWSAPFVSSEGASTQVPPPVVRSWGVIVHRMQGRPITGIDPATGEPGVAFRDQQNYYRPIGDVNLLTNGYLAGSPVVYMTKIHDDFFPPPHGQFGKFPLGVPEPLATPNPNPGPQPHDGARFQTLWRDIDASPSRDALAGTLLDLYRVSWAPIGGNVTSDTYDDVSIHCAHSPIRPLTWQNTAAAGDPFSGLGQPFDWDAWLSVADSSIADQCSLDCLWNSGPNYWDTLVTCVQPGTSYKISQTNLFSPPADGNAYHPWPTFDVRFQYNNGDIPQAEKDLRKSVIDLICPSKGGPAWTEKRNFNPDPDLDNLGGDSLLFEVRIRPQTTNVSRQNGFTMAIGVLLDRFPCFRVWSAGEPGQPLDPDDIANDQRARCAVDPPGVQAWGDNSRYFTVLDYVKTTSRIRSPWVRVKPGNTVDPDYFPAIFQPPLSQQPAGTTALLEFEGANTITGFQGTGFSIDVNVADTKPNVAFRATLVGNVTSLLLPNFDTIAIPYLRPQGS